jgi:hypothetical protein
MSLKPEPEAVFSQRQGDRIGRFFAYWPIVDFAQFFFEN